MTFGDPIHTNVKDVDGVRQALQKAAETLNNITPVTTADGMTADPETDTEDGYLEIDINGTKYQIPIYAK